MRKRFSRFNFVVFMMVVALFPVVFCQGVFAQRTGRPGTSTQGGNRELQVKEIRSGSALDGRGKLWAVVIGVSTYRNLSEKEQLEFAHRDAEDFAAFLRSPFGGGFPSSQLTLLTNQGATLSAIRSALGTTLPRSVEADDMVVIYFAGHGIVENDREGYLLAHDSDPQNLYATALQVSELNRIITERIRARTVILMADACHSGQLGLTSRGVAENNVLVNRYLDEVGKSGKGVFRLMASRADERSYEDKRWGGGHGAFTYYLIQGLKGAADHDKDGFVRAGELLDFLSESVPKATQSLQHPRAAGDLDTRLPLSVLGTAPAKVTETLAIESKPVSLEVRGAQGLEIYLDNVFRGRVLSNGILMVDQLKPGEHDLSIISPNVEPITQKLSLSATRTILNVNDVAASGSPLAGQINRAIKQGKIKEAVDLYQQMIKASPKDAQRSNIEAALSQILESIGQQAINTYVQSSGMEGKPRMFHEGAEAFRLLKTLASTSESNLDAKYYFCGGKALLEEKRYQESVTALEKAVSLDPRSAYAYNALGVAYRSLNKSDRAFDSFRRANELAPSWALPQLHLGQYYFESRKLDKAEQAFKEADRIDPRYPQAREMLVRVYLQTGRAQEAENEAIAIIKKFPNEGFVHLWLGLIYEDKKQWGAAADYYEKGLSLVTNLTVNERDEYSKRLDKCRKKAK